MMKITEIMRGWRKKRWETRRRKLVCQADDVFNVAEYQGQLWLTHNGQLVCPFSLILKDGDPCVLVNTMRKLYIDRNDV